MDVSSFLDLKKSHKKKWSDCKRKIITLQNEIDIIERSIPSFEVRVYKPLLEEIKGELREQKVFENPIVMTNHLPFDMDEGRIHTAVFCDETDIEQKNMYVLKLLDTTAHFYDFYYEDGKIAVLFPNEDSNTLEIKEITTENYMREILSSMKPVGEPKKIVVPEKENSLDEMIKKAKDKTVIRFHAHNDLNKEFDFS